MRTTNHNLSVGLTLLRKNFYNDNIAGRISDYHVYDALLYRERQCVRPAGRRRGQHRLGQRGARLGEHGGFPGGGR